MLYTAEFQQVLERYAREIEDLRTIAKLHGLPVGAPEHLMALPLRLSKDSRLRSDFAELVRSMQVRNSDLGLPDALSVVLAAIGGSSQLDRRRDLEEVVDLTGGFLASLGGWPGSEAEPTIDIDNPPDHDPRLDLAASTSTEVLGPEHAQQAALQEEVTVTDAAFAESDDLGADPHGAVTLAEITHALARLERGNLELRLHLDSIDQRICRMEPLLEAAPHPEPPSPPPDPPRRSPLSTAALAEPADLVHRGSRLSDAEPPLDRLEEIKALRRISLTSNFLDPTHPSSQLPVPASTSLPRNAVASTGVSPSAPSTDPASVAHAQHPRRDRFAAAREMPGNAAETDPLYTGLDEQQVLVDRRADPPDVPTAPLASAVEDEVPSDPSLADVAPEKRISWPAPSSMQTTHEAVPTETRSSTGARARLFNDSPVPSSRAHAGSLPWIVTPPAVSTMDDGLPARGRAAKWVAATVAAAVLGAAGFLYVNGLPAAISEWVSGSSASGSSHAGVDAPATPGGSRFSSDNDLPADPLNVLPRSSPQPGTSSANGAGRVLGARESFRPSTSIEKTEGPTFVPGGIMDGYLVSAPRPVYPEMAKLVGSQGKVTFEAMVSKEGQVEAVKVLGGPQVLRSAATDAVKQWQYRPFAVKGRPVEVRTIIRVDVASHAGAAATE